MKKLSLAIMALLLCVCVSSAQKTHTLVSRILEDYDECYYFYNEKGLVDSVYQHQFLDEWYDTYELSQYDENGNCVRNELWQKMDTGWMHATYIEYTYNEKGLLIKRTNYNNFGGFTKGGDLEYIYNEKDQLVKVNTLMDDFMNPENSLLMSVEEYTYENDLLISRILETNSDPFGWGGGEPEFTPSAKITYKYDSAGQMVAQQNYDYDYETGDEREGALIKFSYDGYGNVTAVSNYLRSENPSSRNIYHYDTTVLQERTIYPLQIEEEEYEWARVMKMSPNIITEVEEWQVPVEVDSLMYVGSYIWNYDVESGVGNRVEREVASLRCMLDNGVLKLDGVPEGCRVEVFTTEGRLIRQARYSERGINLGVLPTGVYIARVNGRASVKFVYSR